jgi:hypothetical protein
MSLSEPIYSSIPFMNDGGPLIVLPRELLSAWLGIDRSPDMAGTVLANGGYEFEGTDYERACAAGDRSAVIPVGNGHGLVLGSSMQVHDVQWLHAPSITGEMLIMPEDTLDHFERDLVKSLQAVTERDWRRIFEGFHVNDHDLILMHASNNASRIVERRNGPYASLGDGVPHRVRPGRYHIEDLDLVLPGFCGFTICRFRAM